MIAPRAAICCVPTDSSIVTTAGKPVGMAAIASVMPMRKIVSKSSPRTRPMIDDQRQRGGRHQRDDHRELVELLGERRLLLLDAAQHPEMCPISVAIPVAVTTISPRPRVTCEFM